MNDLRKTLQGNKKRGASQAPIMRVRPMAPILPPANIQSKALIVVIAIMAFLACLTLGGVSMVRR
jgi:cell division transport system permease protein